jgi:hypothetical protein
MISSCLSSLLVFSLPSFDLSSVLLDGLGASVSNPYALNSLVNLCGLIIFFCFNPNALNSLVNFGLLLISLIFLSDSSSLDSSSEFSSYSSFSFSTSSSSSSSSLSSSGNT